MEQSEFLRLAQRWPSRAALARDLEVSRQMVHNYIHGKAKMSPLRERLFRYLAEKRDLENDGQL